MLRAEKSPQSVNSCSLRKPTSIGVDTVVLVDPIDEIPEQKVHTKEDQAHLDIG